MYKLGSLSKSEANTTRTVVVVVGETGEVEGSNLKRPGQKENFSKIPKI